MDYEILVNAIESLSYHEQMWLNYKQVTQLADKLASLHANTTFDNDILEQLWEECRKNSKEQVLVKDWMRVAVQAKLIIDKNITQLEMKIEMINHRLNELESSASMLASKKGSNANRQHLRKDISNLKRDLNDWFSQHRKLIMLFNKVHQQNTIVEDQKSVILDDNHAVLALFITSICLGLLEMLIIMHRPGFLGLLLVILLSNIFIFYCFDKFYLRLLLMIVVISVLLDIVWVTRKFMTVQYWSINMYVLNLERIIILLTIVALLLKISIAIILFVYRNNQRQQLLEIGKYKIKLYAQADDSLICTYLQDILR